METLEKAIEAGKLGKALLEKALIKSNGIPLMITKDMLQQLLDLGFSKAFINKLKPEEAHKILISKKSEKGVSDIPPVTPEEKTTPAEPEFKEPVQEQQTEAPEASNNIPAQDPPPPNEQTTEQTTTEETSTEETTTEETTTEEPPQLSLWDDIKTPTPEDKNITGNIKNVLTNAIEEGEEVEYDNPDIIKKQADKARAGMHIELIDTLFTLLCCGAHWDFEKEQQQRWKLDDDRKKSLKVALYQMYSANKKTVSPGKAFWGLVAGSYGMTLTWAIFSAIGKWKKAKEEKAKKEIEEQQKRANAEILFLNQLNNVQQIPPAEQTNTTTIIPPEEKKPGGRHPLDCKCNTCINNPKKQKQLKQAIKNGKYAKF